MLTKTLPLKDAGFEKVAAEDDTLALINQFALHPLSPDDVYVRRMVLANDHLDRDHERFSEEVLREFARTLPGKSFLVGHQHGAAPVGRFFHAEVMPAAHPQQTPDCGLQAAATPAPSSRSLESGARSLHLVASFYTVKTQDNEGFRQQIDGGVYSYVSLGFRCQQLLCDICGKDMKSSLCPHYPGKSYNGSAATGTWKGQAEALEASLVYLGAQFGAQFVKRLETCDLRPEEEPHQEKRTPQASSAAAEVLAALATAQGGSPTVPHDVAQGFSPAQSEADLKVCATPPSAADKTQDASHSVIASPPMLGRTACPEPVEGKQSLPTSGLGPESGSRLAFGEVGTAGGGTSAQVSGLKSQVAALETLLEQKDRRLDELAELAQEAKTLRADVVSQILSKSQLIGLPSLHDQKTLSDLPLHHLKSLLHDLTREFDRRFPPQGLSLSPDPDSGLSTLDSRPKSPDLSPFRLP